MKNVSKTALVFHGTQLAVVKKDNHLWLPAPQVAAALQYTDQNSVNRIYSRHADEFTDKMVGSVKLTDPNGTMQETRVFSIRGAHLIAMFARTPVAKEFRSWLLDILEGKRLASPIEQKIPFVCPECGSPAKIIKVAKRHREAIDLHAACIAGECGAIYLLNVRHAYQMES